MAFEWHRMESTPEGNLRKQETSARKTSSLESLASQFAAQAREILNGKDGTAVKEEVSGYAQQILSAREGLEQNEDIGKLLNRLRMRKPAIFGDIPDDMREQNAFVLALVHAYRHSLQ